MYGAQLSPWISVAQLSSDHQQSLAHDGVGLDRGVRFGGLLEGECLPNNRRDPARRGFPQRLLGQSSSVLIA